MTVAQVHQEFTKLVDQISAKFVQLDSGEFGAVGTPAFDAKMHELAVNYVKGLAYPFWLICMTTFLQALSGLFSAKLIVDHGLREANSSIFKNALRLLSASSQ